jgi:diazepam-binding inhibitor (GABA receptor modulating acyl-CoA-binding protein)
MEYELENFTKATQDIKQVSKLDNEKMLNLYGYYKQATIGNCNIDKPNFWDLKGCAKWDAWNSNQNMDKQKAMKYYVKLVNKILSN